MSTDKVRKRDGVHSSSNSGDFDIVVNRQEEARAATLIKALREMCLEKTTQNREVSDLRRTIVTRENSLRSPSNRATERTDAKNLSGGSSVACPQRRPISSETDDGHHQF